jgi:hypothetical protein
MTATSEEQKPVFKLRGPSVFVHVLAGHRLAELSSTASDPYCVVSLGEKKVESTHVVPGGGKDPVWEASNGLVELPWDGEGELEIVIRHKEGGWESYLHDDRKLGSCLVNVGVLAKQGYFKGDLQVYRQGMPTEGKLTVILACQSVSIGESGTLLQPTMARKHQSRIMGAVVAMENAEKFDAFTTYQVALQQVPEVFGDARSAYNPEDAERAKLFQDPMQKLVQAEHACLYKASPWSNLRGPIYEKVSLNSGSAFLSLFGYGVRKGQRRVFTYVLLDSGLYFSETGAKTAKDFLSKHAVHANATPAVRMAGTFRVCDKNGIPILVADNDSGTYCPSAEHLPLLKQVLELNFPGLQIQVLSVLQPQPEETHDLVGPNESPKDTGFVYSGQWKWLESSPQHGDNCDISKKQIVKRKLWFRHRSTSFDDTPNQVTTRLRAATF